MKSHSLGIYLQNENGAFDLPDENGFSPLDGILRDLIEIERETDNRKAQTTMLIIDSKSVQNADTVRTKGYDAGKKTGIKRRIGVDILGLPHVVMLTAANVTDRDGAFQMIFLAFIRLLLARY